MSEMANKLKELLQNYESETIEFKKATTKYDYDKLGKYFSALSNEANLNNKEESWLVFGVDDDKNIVGTQYREDEKN